MFAAISLRALRVSLCSLHGSFGEGDVFSRFSILRLRDRVGVRANRKQVLEGGESRLGSELAVGGRAVSQLVMFALICGDERASDQNKVPAGVVI